MTPFDIPGSPMLNPLTPTKLREQEIKDKCWELFAFVVIDADSVIQRVNAAFETMFGYIPGELNGQPMDVVLEKKIQTAHDRYVKTFFDSPEPRPMTLKPDVQAVHKDGHMIKVTVTLSAFFDEGHNQYAIACVSEAR